jgi:hypothetical protein
MTVWKDGAVSAIAPSVSEIAGSPGEYNIEFVPDDLGVWFLEVKSDYDGKVWEEDFIVGKTQHLEAQFEAADSGVNTEFGVWIEVNGEPKLDLTSVGLKLYDNDGTEVWDLGTQVGKTTEGVYKFTMLTSKFAALKPYYLGVTATQGTIVWKRNLALATS